MNGIKKYKIGEMAIKDLKAAPYNPRRITEKAMKGLEASMVTSNLGAI